MILKKIPFLILCSGLILLCTACDETEAISIAGGISFILFGIVSIGTIFLARKYSQNIEKWPTTKGHVLEKKIIKAKVKSTRRSAQSEVYVKYEYSIGETSYTSDRTTPGGLIFSRAEAEMIIDEKIPEKIAVYYNPEKPNESYLFPIPQQSKQLILILGIIFIVIGIAFFYVFDVN